MAFPFYPVGAITGTLVLVGAYVTFRLLLLALDRGAAELRGSIGPGLVRGVRAWAGEHEDPPAPTAAPDRADVPLRGDLPIGASLEELSLSPDIPVEGVHRRTHRR